MREEYQYCLDNIVNTTVPMIIMPDAGILQANNRGYLPLPSTLSPAEAINTIVTGLKSYSLFSLGQLCDNVFNVLINKQKMEAIKYKEVVIEGKWNNYDGLWDIIIISHPNGKISVQINIYTTTESHASLYAETPNYKRQHILSVTVQRP